MRKYLTKTLNLTFMFLICLTLFSCGVLKKLFVQFEDFCQTSPDGFYYYYREQPSKGAYILEIPDSEELTIPEYIEGKKVVELGHREIGLGYEKNYLIKGNNTKKLTIKHKFDICIDQKPKEVRKYYVDFPNLTNLTFVDFLYCNRDATEEELLVPHYIGRKRQNVPDVELKKSNRKYSLEKFTSKVIVIPEYVKIIEKDVFAGLTDVTIKTSYTTKPEGWEDGWNGNCNVEWGEEITYFTFKDRCEYVDGFLYFYNNDTKEGAYILNTPYKDEVVIPEYIEGKKVKKLGYYYKDDNILIDYDILVSSVEKLTIQHQFEIETAFSPEYVWFPNVTNLVFLDFLYCNSITPQEEITVPCYIGKKGRWPSIVELRKTNREFSLTEFNPKVIIIPEYVEIIDKDVFAGLTDVTIKTPYTSKPEGWEDGWNGTCKVEWGSTIKN